MSVEENDSRDVSTRQDTTSELTFDSLARGLASGAVSRRQAVRLLGGAALGSALALIPGVASAAPQTGGVTKCKNLFEKCITNVECCSRFCDKNGKQCACPPEAGLACNNRCVPKCHDTTDPCKVSLCDPTTGNCVVGNAPNGTPCEDGNLCTVGDTCQSGQCQAGRVTICEASSNPCAVLECDRTTGLCEPQPANAGAVCRPAQGECDLPALCTGTDLGCPDNPLKAVGTVCREAAGPCDVAEVCNGTSAQCPENEFLPAGTVCLEAQGPCAGPSLCSGNSAQCPENPLLPDTSVCREAAGPCDVPEFCTGTSNQCPENEFLPAGTICLESQGPCAGPSLCSGNSATCPDNPFLPDTTICRPAANQCDVPEFCTGTSNQCPENRFKPDGTPCDNDNNLCTLDTCQNGVCRGGPQKTCPASTDPCKVNVCNPATGDCVTQNAPNGTVCEDGNLCTVGDTCQSGRCQAGSPKTCPASTDPCKVNVCVPATGLCVTQNGPNGVPCNDNNLCTTGETCNNGTCQGGTQKTCPAGQTCVPATGVCQCTTGVTCGNICCSGNQGTCCPTGTRRAGQCRSNLNACNQ